MTCECLYFAETDFTLLSVSVESSDDSFVFLSNELKNFVCTILWSSCIAIYKQINVQMFIEREIWNVSEEV